MKKQKTAKKLPSKGEELLNQVIRLTGIPAGTIRNELHAILERKNIDIRHLTLDQLRSVVASYLREIMGNVLDRCHRKGETQH